MDDVSIFMDKTNVPADHDLLEKIGQSFSWWTEIREFVLASCINCKAEWNFPGKNYGWSYRIKDKKRAIIYLLPLNGCFKVAFVFGQKATDQILESDISAEIKDQLIKATKYAEGRGIRIDVTNDHILLEIKKLVRIKMEN
jgi:hypothetical protein